MEQFMEKYSSESESQLFFQLQVNLWWTQKLFPKVSPDKMHGKNVLGVVGIFQTSSLPVMVKEWLK